MQVRLSFEGILLFECHLPLEGFTLVLQLPQGAVVRPRHPQFLQLLLLLAFADVCIQFNLEFFLLQNAQLLSHIDELVLSLAQRLIRLPLEGLAELELLGLAGYLCLEGSYFVGVLLVRLRHLLQELLHVRNGLNRFLLLVFERVLKLGLHGAQLRNFVGLRLVLLLPFLLAGAEPALLLRCFQLKLLDQHGLIHRLIRGEGRHVHRRFVRQGSRRFWLCHWFLLFAGRCAERHRWFFLSWL